jgi:hypothetical protein
MSIKKTASTRRNPPHQKAWHRPLATMFYLLAPSSPGFQIKVLGRTIIFQASSDMHHAQGSTLVGCRMALLRQRPAVNQRTCFANRFTTRCHGHKSNWAEWWRKVLAEEMRCSVIFRPFRHRGQWGNAALVTRSKLFRRLVLAAIGRVSSGNHRLESAGHVVNTRRETRLCAPPGAVGFTSDPLI